MDQVREVLRYHHYSLRTEKTYCDWIVRFIKFHGTRHPQEMGKAEIETFLSYLAQKQHVAKATQNQAFNALLFLYRHVLDLPERMGCVEAVRSRRPKKMPTVLTKDEVKLLLAQLEGSSLLMAKVLYGSGLRVSELVRLRVKDLDFGNHALVVCDGKGNKDRITILPASLHEPLQDHLARVRALFEEDLREGKCNTYIPQGLDRKLTSASQQWIWQYAFPSQKLSTDPRTGQTRRHHVFTGTIGGGKPLRVTPLLFAARRNR